MSRAWLCAIFAVIAATMGGCKSAALTRIDYSIGLGVRTLSSAVTVGPTPEPLPSPTPSNSSLSIASDPSAPEDSQTVPDEFKTSYTASNSSSEFGIVGRIGEFNFSYGEKIPQSEISQAQYGTGSASSSQGTYVGDYFSFSIWQTKNKGFYLSEPAPDAASSTTEVVTYTSEPDFTYASRSFIMQFAPLPRFFSMPLVYNHARTGTIVGASPILGYSINEFELSNSRPLVHSSYSDKFEKGEDKITGIKSLGHGALFGFGFNACVRGLFIGQTVLMGSMARTIQLSGIDAPEYKSHDFMYQFRLDAGYSGPYSFTVISITSPGHSIEYEGLLIEPGEMNFEFSMGFQH